MQSLKGKGHYRTRIITDRKDVPSGYVALAALVPVEKNQKQHQYLSRAHTAGHLRAVKLQRYASDARFGQVFVDKEQALELLGEYELVGGENRGRGRPRNQEPQTDTLAAAVASLTEQLKTQQSSLELMVGVLRDLRAAAELQNEAAASVALARNGHG